LLIEFGDDKPCVAWGTAQPRALSMFEGLVVSEVPKCGVKAHVLKETQGSGW
jgi:hypothetical protein